MVSPNFLYRDRYIYLTLTQQPAHIPKPYDLQNITEKLAH